MQGCVDIIHGAHFRICRLPVMSATESDYVPSDSEEATFPPASTPSYAQPEPPPERLRGASVLRARRNEQRVECEKCKKTVLKPHIARHRKTCKGLRSAPAQEEIRARQREANRRSYQKHKEKRVKESRLNRAKDEYRHFLSLRRAIEIDERNKEELQTVKPKGLPDDHPFRPISFYPEFFEFLMGKISAYEPLSKVWFKRCYLIIHPDMTSRLPKQFQTPELLADIKEATKRFSDFKDIVAEFPIHGNDIVDELSEYQRYLKDVYPIEASVQAEIMAESIKELDETIAGYRKTLTSKYGAYQDCKSLEEFQAIYMRRFETSEGP